MKVTSNTYPSITDFTLHSIHSYSLQFGNFFFQSTVRRGNTHTQQKAQLELSRRREEHREDTLKSLARDQMESANILSEERVEDKRFIRALQQEQKEAEMQEAIIKVQHKMFIFPHFI